MDLIISAFLKPAPFSIEAKHLPFRLGDQTSSVTFDSLGRLRNHRASKQASLRPIEMSPVIIKGQDSCLHLEFLKPGHKGLL